jgi:hypothetical protein
MRKRFLIFLFLILLPLSGFALNIRIDTPKVKLKVKPGEVVRGTIGLENPTPNTVKLKAYLTDFLYVPPYDGTKEFFASGTTQLSCARWIDFSPQEITLLPFAKRRVNYTIKAPPQLKGGHYAVLFFETSLGAIEEPKEGVNVVILGRIGTLFFLEAEGSLKRAEIENLEAEENRIKGEFANLGNVVLVAKGNFYIMDENGIVVDRGKIRDFYLFPGDKVSFSIDILENIGWGRYTLVASFDLEEGDILVREIDFSKDRFGLIKLLEVRR